MRVSVVHQQDMLRPTIKRVPDGIIIFSSDFPHVEGHQDAVALYNAQLKGLPQSTRESFLAVQPPSFWAYDFKGKVTA